MRDGSLTTASLDKRLRVSGALSNDTSTPTVWVTLLVTNMTESDLYVPTHFNSINYNSQVGSGGTGYHGDDRLASFEDFVRLAPAQGLQITSAFGVRHVRPGQGQFSVHFYNNLEPAIEERLKASGVPFVVELEYDFGRVTMKSSTRRVERTGGSRFDERRGRASAAAASRRSP
jgi:hypothetical protein